MMSSIIGERCRTISLPHCSQINQLLAWKQDNKRLSRDQGKNVKDYIHSRMSQDYTLNHAGDFQIEKHIRNYGLVSVLDKVDDAYFSKIKFNAFLRVEQGGDLSKQIYYTGGICKNNFGEYCKKECLRRLFDYVRALEPYYSEEELILDIKGTVQQRTKFMSGLPDWRAFMDNHQREMLRAKGKLA